MTICALCGQAAGVLYTNGCDKCLYSYLLAPDPLSDQIATLTAQLADRDRRLREIYSIAECMDDDPLLAKALRHLSEVPS